MVRPHEPARPDGAAPDGAPPEGAPPEGSDQTLDAAGAPARARGARPSLLVTLADLAWPYDRGKRVRAGNALRGLAEVGDVDLVVLPGPDVDPGPPALPPGVRVRRAAAVATPLRPKPVAGAVLARRRVPWQMAVRDWSAVRAGLRAAQEYDLVWFGASDHAVMLGDLVRARRTVVDMDDVETGKHTAYLRLPPTPGLEARLDRVQRRVELPMWRGIERRLTRTADLVTVCSELDRRRLGAAPSVVVIPNCYPEPGARRAPRTGRGTRLVMVANYDYEPNSDAARWLVDRVLPLVRDRIPDATLALVGRSGEHRLAGLAGRPGVAVVGTVDDPVAHLIAADVAVAPVRYGGGTRIKLLEAFACGMPAITTALGCEGLHVADDVDVLVRDTPEDFASGCVRLLEDPDLARRLVGSARAVYEAEYRPEVAVGQVARLVEGLLASG